MLWIGLKRHRRSSSGGGRRGRQPASAPRRRATLPIVLLAGGVVLSAAPGYSADPSRAPAPDQRVASAAATGSLPAPPGSRAPALPASVHDSATLQVALDHLLASTFPGRELRWSLPREHPWAGFDGGAGAAYRLIVPETLHGGRNWFHLDPAGGEGAFLLPVDVSWRDTAWVALRALPAGHVFGAGDVDRQVRWHTHPPAEVRDCPPPLGARLLQSVGCGAVIRAGLLGTPPLVERGDVLRLVYRRAGLEIITRANAVEEGWAGDAIRVRPFDSHRICQARIAAAGLAEVIVP